MLKILVIQTSFIGDVILATAIIEKLHTTYPNAQLYLLVRKGNESLFREHPYLKEVFVWNKKSKKYKNLLQLLKYIRQQRFDYIINLQRYAATGFLTAFSKAKTTFGFTKNPFSRWFNKKYTHQIGDGTHEVERNHQLITTITDDKHGFPKLYPNIEDFETVLPYITIPYIVVAPASVWQTKQLPATKWEELISLHSNISIYLIGAPSDFEYCQSIINNVSHANIQNLAGKLSLLQSAALISKAKMSYVNDSAPLHLASAMNAPVTAFFCSTSPKFGFGPLSDISLVVEATENLSCRPCGIHGKKVCPKGHFKCGKMIEIDNANLIIKNEGE